MSNKRLKRIMTDLAAGHITHKEADKLTKEEKTPEEEPEDEIEGKEEIAPINSKNGKEQRDKAMEKLSKEAEKEETQKRTTKSNRRKK